MSAWRSGRVPAPAERGVQGNNVSGEGGLALGKGILGRVDRASGQGDAQIVFQPVQIALVEISTASVYAVIDAVSHC